MELLDTETCICFDRDVFRYLTYINGAICLFVCNNFKVIYLFVYDKQL